MTADERDFDQRYRIVEHSPLLEIEKKVLGSDFGGTSYTTRTQAEQLASVLDLCTGKWLLDVGSGAGWPAAFLASETGCTAVLTEPSTEGARVAARRMRRQGLNGGAVVASGGALPVRNASFDAVSSGDVFC